MSVNSYDILLLIFVGWVIGFWIGSFEMAFQILKDQIPEYTRRMMLKDYYSFWIKENKNERK